MPNRPVPRYASLNATHASKLPFRHNTLLFWKKVYYVLFVVYERYNRNKNRFFWKITWTIENAFLCLDLQLKTIIILIEKYSNIEQSSKQKKKLHCDPRPTAFPIETLDIFHRRNHWHLQTPRQRALFERKKKKILVLNGWNVKNKNKKKTI